MDCSDTISCSALKIKDWKIDVPDYVFEKEYDLMTLGMVEEYIGKEKHLPGVPSGSEIRKNGLDLATMNCTLLKKIEELTLYIINQEKRIANLECRVVKIDTSGIVRK